MYVLLYGHYDHGHCALSICHQFDANVSAQGDDERIELGADPDQPLPGEQVTFIGSNIQILRLVKR